MPGSNVNIQASDLFPNIPDKLGSMTLSVPQGMQGQDLTNYVGNNYSSLAPYIKGYTKPPVKINTGGTTNVDSNRVNIQASDLFPDINSKLGAMTLSVPKGLEGNALTTWVAMNYPNLAPFINSLNHPPSNPPGYGDNGGGTYTGGPDDQGQGTGTSTGTGTSNPTSPTDPTGGATVSPVTPVTTEPGYGATAQDWLNYLLGNVGDSSLYSNDIRKENQGILGAYENQMVDQQTQQSQLVAYLNDMIQNGLPNMNQYLQQGTTSINQGFNLANRQLQGQMASQGLGRSGIAAGATADLMGQKENALATLGTNLSSLDTQYRQNAVSQLLGVNQNQASNALNQLNSLQNMMYNNWYAVSGHKEGATPLSSQPGMVAAQSIGGVLGGLLTAPMTGGTSLLGGLASSIGGLLGL